MRPECMRTDRTRVFYEVAACLAHLQAPLKDREVGITPQEGESMAMQTMESCIFFNVTMKIGRKREQLVLRTFSKDIASDCARILNVPVGDRAIRAQIRTYEVTQFRELLSSPTQSQDQRKLKSPA
jgi:hypothetical protein